MRAAEANDTFHWLCTGEVVFPAMLEAIESAEKSVLLETYIFTPSELANRFRAALERASRRGVRVRVLLDALGSRALPADYWKELAESGGEVRLFNPLALNRFWIRNHRKLLVCDDSAAFVGGFNIAPEYEGDGIVCGWCDIGLQLQGPLAVQLAASFEEMFQLAEFRHKRFMRFHKFNAKRTVDFPKEQILLSGPGKGRSPIKRALHEDLKHARNVQIVAAYFLPTWRLRRDLGMVARRGGRVQIILAGKSDVTLSQLAGRSLYRRFLNAGVRIHEYQPQILHAKLMIVDDAVYVGSANLDQRSLNINYELMIRFQNEGMAAEAREVFARSLEHCREITRDEWVSKRTLWRTLKQRWAYFVLVRVDPYVAQWQWRALPD